MQVGDCEGQVAEMRDFSALPSRSEHIVFVGARYKHVRCTNSKPRVLPVIGRLSERLKSGAVLDCTVAPNLKSDKL